MNEPPEFSRPIRLDTLSGEARAVEVEAKPAERQALARRFGFVALDHLSAEASIVRRGEMVSGSGRLRAAVTRSCVATGEPIEERVEEEFQVEFRPQRESGRGEEEVELSEGEMDVVFYEGGAIDLGEAVAETLSLGLDPYPRCASADEALKAAGVSTEEEARAAASPFAALEGLKGKLEP